MEKVSEKEAIRLLRKYANSKKDFDGVLKHSRAVQRLAIEIGKKVKDIDLDFIKIASLLHDIGRFEYGPGSRDSIRHGVFGGKLLRKENLGRYALVAERHLGAGISKEDILEQGLSLPLKDYIPISKEEKIITHADNLVKYYKRISLQQAVRRYEKELGKKVAKKIEKLGRGVEKMRI